MNNKNLWIMLWVKHKQLKKRIQTSHQSILTTHCTFYSWCTRPNSMISTSSWIMTTYLCTHRVAWVSCCSISSVFPLICRISVICYLSILRVFKGFTIVWNKWCLLKYFKDLNILRKNGSNWYHLWYSNKIWH